MPGGYPGMGPAPMVPGQPGMAAPATPYGTDASGQPVADPNQLYGTGTGDPAAGSTAPMGPTGPMAAGPGGYAPPPGYSPNPFAPPPDAVPGVPPLANAPGQAPPGMMAGPMAMTAPPTGPSGVASAQAAPSTLLPPAPTAGGAAVDTIRIVDTSEGGVGIDPTPVRYPVSRQITWINNSSQIVQIASDDNATFDSGPLAPGESFSYTPGLIGSVFYRDRMHPWVRAVLVSTGQ
jgi:hypothetical protein